MEIAKKEWFRTASGKNGKIFSRSWTGEETKAIIVIAHGMAEHSARYDGFASFLAGRGYAVYMNDHAGHGRSTQRQGHFADENGWEYVVRDLKTLMDQGEREHPEAPRFLMGHSMGSFLSRSYLIRYGEGLSGCILCGTMGKNPQVKVGKALASLQCRVMGSQSRGRFLDKISMGAYNKGIQNPVNQFAWLSTDEENCRAYENDPLCGFAFTAAGYRDLFTGLEEIGGPDWAGKVPKDVPILLLAGDKDPVGNYGKGPVQVGESLRSAGVKDVEWKIYPGLRHELLNETGKEQIWEDAVTWLDEKREHA